MRTVLVDDNTAKLQRWAHPDYSDEVAQALDQIEFVRRFRQFDFDFALLKPDGWYGYKFKTEFARLADTARALVNIVYRTTLNRSIA